MVGRQGRGPGGFGVICGDFGVICGEFGAVLRTILRAGGLTIWAENAR